LPAHAHPPFDAELEPALAGLPPFFTTLEPSAIPEFRAATTHPPSIGDVIAGRPVDVADHTVTGHDGGEIVVSVLRRSGHEGAASPGIYFLHGGGMIGGSRWSVASMLVEWVLEYDAVAATVEYRLAPEFPDPAPVEDCYAGLEWFTDRAEEFGFDPRRVLIGGPSAGGGLSAGTTLLARDRGGPMPVA
jgi:acetyl esterase/lipase